MENKLKINMNIKKLDRRQKVSLDPEIKKLLVTKKDVISEPTISQRIMAIESAIADIAIAQAEVKK